MTFRLRQNSWKCGGIHFEIADGRHFLYITDDLRIDTGKIHLGT